MNFKVPIEVSARHIHLTQDDLEKLFGLDCELKVFKKVSQPGQFACEEVVTVVSPKGKLDNVRIIGPVRNHTQLEISATDAYLLGIKPLIRISGDLEGTNGGVKIVGPRGEIDLHQGVIIAERHLHIEPEKAKRLNLKHGQVISINTFGARPITFYDVAVRSRENVDELSFMIDTDEANAAGLVGGEFGEMI